MNRLLSMSELPGDRLRHALAKVPHLELVDSHRGILRSRQRAVDVLLEPGDWISTTLSIDKPPEPDVAIRINHSLAGNVRFARDRQRLILVAETQANGEAHLARTFANIRRGMDQALGARARRGKPGQPIKVDAVQGVLDKLGWPEQAVVRRDDGWEMRPHIRGTSLPLRLQLKDDRLWLHRTVLKTLPTGDAAEAVVDQALRFNRELRLARLAIVDETLVVETRLHSQQVSSYWLRTASLAVATASRHVQTVIRILAEQGDVASCYVEVVCRPD